MTTRRSLPRRRWIATVVAPTDGGAGDHGGARARLGRVPRHPKKVWERSGEGEAVCRDELLFCRRSLPKKKMKTASAGKGIQDTTRAVKRQISKREHVRCSGKKLLPECVRGGGCRPQVGSAGDVAGGRGAGSDGSCLARLGGIR